jgi:type I restriction enzyme S subunit
MSERKVPKLRFPGFTSDWEQRKLADICERVQGNDGRMDLPTLTISAANGWMSQEDRFSGNIAGKEQKNYTLLHKGELSYNHGNSKLAKYGTVFSLESYEEALVPRVYHSFKMTAGDAKFIEYMFATKKPDIELSKLISSGARMDGLLNIGFNEFMGINITIPSADEQTKISGFIANIDNLITLHQRKYEEIKQYKTGMLQKMFPKEGESVPEIRFSGFSDAWEQRKLGDVAKFRQGIQVDLENQYTEYADGRERFIRIVDYTQGTDDIRYIDEVESANHVDLDDVVVVRYGATAGFVGHGITGIIANNMFTINPSDSIKKDFLYTFMKQEKMYESLNSSNGSSAMPAINFGIMSNIEISYPTIEEQARIGGYFEKLDNLITLHQRKCDMYKELKKGLLQQMFV